jgi:hypothetical protein
MSKDHARIKARYPQHPMEAVHGDVVESEKSNEEFNADIAREIIKRKDRLTDQSVDLALRALEAQESLEWSVNHFRRVWIEWAETANERLHDMTLWRMAFGREVKQIITDASDIRQFFLDEKHLEQVRRLKEFVELCERLKALKQDGTLDAIADTMLKLAV